MELDLDLNEKKLIDRIRRDLADSNDEEFELELEDRNLEAAGGGELDMESEQYRNSRKLYFRELFRLQAEL
ncbi:MAG TPA: polyphosphate kinase 2, partial [Rhodoferax sp.]|nr:polyphosphate kinase 2 [Rhodoferax sp.]